MADELIRDVIALEDCIGKTPAAINMKVISHLDAGAIDWLAASPLMFVGFGGENGVFITLAGGVPKFASVTDPSRIRLPVSLVDDPTLAHPGHGFGALFLVPSLRETLRINGRVESVSDEAIHLRVEECYVHCGKAMIRSGFWDNHSDVKSASSPSLFLSQCRFIAVATSDAEGHADVSPKGDPAGNMIVLKDDCVCYADRPGNRRADSFRNILTEPRVSIIGIIPGSTQIANIRGPARITRDAHVRADFSVKDKVPKLATCIAHPDIHLSESPSLARARLWPAAQLGSEKISAVDMMIAHVKLNERRGLLASVMRCAVSLPNLLKRGMARDYKDNLY